MSNPTMDASTFADNVADAHRTIARAAKHAGLRDLKPEIMAVSKRQPDDRIECALRAGQRLFGENQVQEAQKRWAHRRDAFPDLRLHLIGGLQTNKAGDAVALFDVIESVDRIKLADKLKAAMDKQDRHIPILLQVNTGREDQKGGVLPEELEALYRHCQSIGLEVKGLMAIPPADDNPALHFGYLVQKAKELGLDDLSMGMSGDYPLAATMGATRIRIGTALFGTRTS